MNPVREPKNSEILIYQNTDGRIKIDVMLNQETVWLTIAQMAELFQKSRSTINEHILNIYREGELEEEASLRKIGNSDFSVKPTNYYNLDVIISVGYQCANRRGIDLPQGRWFFATHGHAVAGQNKRGGNP